ncbi:MAG: Glyoxalase family protein [uncultured Chloroflexi bacterium]|uniref:Glyoxalase family protein n=1 Tax=uncultured Chloroflexota bacterium TaxID=166587 RepID=A0A6J4JS85_9CHLR|nr:MAG: Glyoxalase family protein [uncultured Chloroflexota bacterium]
MQRGRGCYDGAVPVKPRKLFLNLPISNLKRSVDFFTALGFSFDPRFTSENATCMILNDEAFVMLLEEDFFKSFHKKDIADPNRQMEAIMAISADSRADVDDLVDKALAAGATSSKPADDHGFMYQRTFQDLDGHHWEVVWMEMAAFEQLAKQSG